VIILWNHAFGLQAQVKKIGSVCVVCVLLWMCCVCVIVPLSFIMLLFLPVYLCLFALRGFLVWGFRVEGIGVKDFLAKNKQKFKQRVQFWLVIVSMYSIMLLYVPAFNAFSFLSHSHA